MPRFIVSVLCFLGLASGCDSEAENPTFESQEQQMIAAQGGTITLSDGASVIIPPDALQTDSKVVFSRLECPPIFRTSRFGTCPYEVRLESDLLERAEVQLPSQARDSDCPIFLRVRYPSARVQTPHSIIAAEIFLGLGTWSVRAPLENNWAAAIQKAQRGIRVAQRVNTTGPINSRFTRLWSLPKAALNLDMMGL
jgi:hypothetical protein